MPRSTGSRLRCFLVLCSVYLPAPASAELIWEDPVDVKEHFEQAVRSILPERCLPPKRKLDVGDEDPLIGYNSAQATGPRTISFEVVLKLDGSCFDVAQRAFLRRMQAKPPKPIMSAAYAYRLEPYFTADGGPTFIFRFRASENDIARLRRANGQQ